MNGLFYPHASSSPAHLLRVVVGLVRVLHVMNLAIDLLKKIKAVQENTVAVLLPAELRGIVADKNAVRIQ